MIGLIKIGELNVKTLVASPNDVQGNPLYVFSGTIDTDLYKDITSNENWMSIGQNRYDYIFCRNQVASWTSVNSFSSLTINEQICAASNFVVGATDRNVVLSSDEQQIAWSNIIRETRNSRQLRWSSAKSYISYVLPMQDSIDIGKSTTTLSNEYIVYGVESFAKSGDDGLFDWLGNTAKFSGGTGYSGKSYWTQEHQDKMLEILINGLY
jgi:hypothetical protein